VLHAAGLQVLARNWRGFGGELDAVAMDDRGLLVFVEIRTRTRDDRGDAIETVGLAKQRQIAKAAQHYLAFAKPPRRVTGVRFDIVGITANRVTHLVDAFRA